MGPYPRGGEIRPRRAGPFCRLRRREGRCRTAAGVCKRGYRTPGLTSRFPIPPLATPPDLPVCRDALRDTRLKSGGTQLRPRYNLGRFDAVWGWLRARFPRISVRGSGFRSDRLKILRLICLDGTQPCGCRPEKPCTARGTASFPAASKTSREEARFFVYCYKIARNEPFILENRHVKW